ncbi:MAG: helix-turn-helix domain-containing protein, partial [Pseudonocardiaceae bacterium]
PVARTALARRDVAAVYRILCAAGVSRMTIARATGQQQSEVSAVLAGRRVQSIALLERIADGLGVPRGWMGLAYTPEVGSEPAAEAVSEDERSANLFRHAATLLFGAPVFGLADPIRDEEPALTPMPSRIGPDDVACLVATTTRLGWLSDNLGGVGMSDGLTAHAQTAETLLSADMRDEVRQVLLVALADVHLAAGWSAGDAGLRHRARQHFARGMSCAGAAGDKVRVVVNLQGEAVTELHLGSPNEALKLFQLGAGGAPTEETRAVLEYDCAWALAQLDLVEEAYAALRRALDASKRAAVELRPWRHFANGLPIIDGCTQLALGRFEPAVQALTVAAQGADHAARCSTLNLSELATAQLRCGELRDGLQTAAQVVDKARTLRSVWVRERLAQLQQAAAARKDSACQDLAHELAGLRSAA